MANYGKDHHYSALQVMAVAFNGGKCDLVHLETNGRLIVVTYCKSLQEKIFHRLGRPIETDGFGSTME